MNCKEKLLEVRDIHKVYTKEGVPTKALNGITFDVLDGEFLGIMGASGSGKTTLLNCIATVIKPTSGQVLLSGANVSSFDSEKLAEYRGNKIGYLFQDFALLDNLTGRENILLPLSIHNVDISAAEKKLNDIAGLFGITDVLSKFPAQMSGGQKQRVAIAGVMAMRPRCIILDEPTAMLDPNGRKEVLEAVRELNRKEKVTVILITHYMEEVIHADRVYVMDSGNVVMQGNPKEIFSQVDTLKKYGLDVPQVTLLAYELKKSGVDVPDGILTTEELVSALCQSN